MQVAWNKGMKMSADFRKKCREGRSGIKLSESHCVAISKSLTGKRRKPFSREHCLNLRLSHLGKKVGVNHHNWKGDKASYRTIHTWLSYNYGKADKCEICNTKVKQVFQWANKSGDYLRDISDWIMTCRSCHRKRDMAKKRGEKCLTF